MTVLTILAKAPTGEAAKSGPWGLAVILILCAVCYFLFKSMSKHMRRVREDFPTRDAKVAKTDERATAAPDVPVAPESPTGQSETARTDADQARGDAGSPGAGLSGA